MSHQLIREGKSMTIVTVGIDLAKNVIVVRGVEESGKPALVCLEVSLAELLGHSDVSATVIYTQVLKAVGGSTASPLCNR